MDRLNERLGVASRALKSFNELANIANPSAIERDAAIQRFEYTFEAVWKAVKLYLNAVEGIDVASPKSVVRASLEVGLFDEDTARQTLKMADDRNLTSHTYNEQLALQIMARIPQHANVLVQWLDAVAARADKIG